MLIRHAAAPAQSGLARYFGLPLCPRCGDLLLAPDASDFVSDGRVRHLWSCEACGHEVRTFVALGRD
jgi:hypothetical protein